jgi:hypothetical protein
MAHRCYSSQFRNDRGAPPARWGRAPAVPGSIAGESNNRAGIDRFRRFARTRSYISGHTEIPQAFRADWLLISQQYFRPVSYTI